MKVPYVDIGLGNEALREDIMRGISDVIASGSYSGGRFVEEFENHFATYCQTSNVVAVGSGTEAIWLTLVAMGIGPGDEVVTVPMSFAATVEAILMAGARPVFVDIDAQSYTMDPAKLPEAITARTKAIIPVHLFGQVADMDTILKIAHSRGIRVIEDAAQAHGAGYTGQKAGSIGDAGCFSFHPCKNLGGIGESGAVITEDKALARRIRILRNHGQSRKNEHSVVGWNSRMDGIQGEILRLKLRYLDDNNKIRQRQAKKYNHAFSDLMGIIPPSLIEGRNHVFHIYSLRVHDRLNLFQILKRNGIGYGVHYPKPIHLQSAYQSLGYNPGDFPVSELFATQFISLPIFPEMTDNQITFVIDVVQEFGRIAKIA